MAGRPAGSNPDMPGVPGVTVPQADDGLSRGVMANHPQAVREVTADGGGTCLVTPGAGYPAGANKSGRPGTPDPAPSLSAAGTPAKLKQ